MKTYTPDELKIVLDKHAKWRRGEVDGDRADLADAYRNAPANRAEYAQRYRERKGARQ